MASRSRTLSLTLPPFAGFIRRLVLANVIVFFAIAVIGIAAPNAASFLTIHLVLTPHLVLHGQLWQLVTYSFLHFSILDILLSMLMLWFIGSYLESTLGPRWVAELYFTSVLGAALTSIAFAYSHIRLFSPSASVYGSSGGLFGLLVAFGILFGDQETMPFRIRAKYLVAIYILLELAFTLRGNFMSLATLGGALFGYLFVKFAPRRGFFTGTRQWYFNLRNAWYRNRRRRAAKKFEVYMGKQGREVHFDKDGKYIDPDKDSNKWVN